jgi:hypothetical protein
MRCLLLLVGTLSLAFAPAPFPRSRPATSRTFISLDVFQGRWKVVRMETTLPNGKRNAWNWGVKTIRVRGGQMAYLSGSAADTRAPDYPLSIVAGNGRTAIDWYFPGEKVSGSPRMVGLIKRDGDTIQILYKPHTGPRERPKGFENPPEGWYLKTLKRER